MEKMGLLENALMGGQASPIKPIGDIIGTRKLFCVSPDDKARFACRVMTNRRRGALPVVDDNGALVGIISERDIVRRCIGQKRRTGVTPVSEVMTPNPIFCSPQESLIVGLTLMIHNHIRHLPIVDQGRLIGVVSVREVIAELSTAVVREFGLHTLTQEHAPAHPGADYEE